MSAAHKVQWPTIFEGLQGMTLANLSSEVSAGITLAALIIPLNIGYAQVAGLPPVFLWLYLPYSPALAMLLEALMPPFLRSWERYLLAMLR